MPFWDPKEEDVPPAGLSPPAGSSRDCQPLAQKEGFSPLPVVSPEELRGLRAERKVEFIQSLPTQGNSPIQGAPINVPGASV